MRVSKWLVFFVSTIAALSWQTTTAARWAEGSSATAYERRKEAKIRQNEAEKKYRPGVAQQQPAIMAPLPGPYIGFNPAVDYNVPNFANSPNLRKFVDSLPGLGAANANNLGNYIPVATPDVSTYPGSDYYEIGLKDYQQQLHSDLPLAGTQLRGYYQINGLDNSAQYLGPLVIAHRDRPVRFKFVNELGINGAGDLRLPVDTTVMGAGMGPLDANGVACDPTIANCAMYTQNRATIHLHGGFTPWISDGTPHQWITPAGDATPFKKGVSFQNVPDMVGPGKSIPAPSAGDGMATFYYPNQQSARLMFYHDHAYGTTRLNVYAGEAAGYLLTDQVEDDLIDGTNVSNVFGGSCPVNGPCPKILPDQGDPAGAYRYGIPLIIQDKTFVNDATTTPHASFALTGATPTPATALVDPLWYTYVPGSVGGNLWLPHEYMPNENIFDTTGFNPLGRWDYGPWMIPPMPALNDTLPSPTIIPEAFGDTALVNGAAFPYVTLPAAPLRFRILNASNDRILNLQLYYAATPSGIVCTGDTPDPITGVPPVDPSTCTEVSMVPATPNTSFPTWPRDGRDGGVPDPMTQGPSMIQIGNEGGLLTKPAIVPPQPIDFDYNRRSVTFGGVTSKSLLLIPAVRADVIVDFSSVLPGSTLILYNDAPAPMPLYDARNDYFTDDPDQTGSGGAPSTPPGFGPNTRTMMQIRIDPNAPQGAAYDTAALDAALPAAFAMSQDPLLVPPGVYAQSVDETLNTTGIAQPVVRVVTTLPGLGYTKPPTVKFASGGCAPVPSATASLNGVTGITLVTAGTGYTSPPTVTIAAPKGGGIQATAAATVSGGVVTVISIINPGSNYTVAPTVTITGGGGTGATAVAAITIGSVGTITLVTPGSCMKAPLVTLTGGNGTGATASALLQGDLIMTGKNLVEGFDMNFGRMNAVLGSTPSPLAPTVGAGPVIGAAFYIDPPTEIMTGGETVLWRIAHIGVDSHAIHFHMFNVQVVNRVDWTNTIKPPYADELGWKETIRTNPFEDIIVAIRPVKMTLPFAVPESNRLLDPTMLPGAVGNFQPVAPPPGFPAVAQTTNVVTNFAWEYVWHCHLLGHEENDMMRPIVFVPERPVANVAPTALGFSNQKTGTTSAPRTVTLSNTGTAPLLIASITIAGANPGDFQANSSCPSSLAAGTSCTISVTFRPTVKTNRSATLIVTDNSNGLANSQQTVVLTGKGI
jgi:FtsP/CotA-like multicopper oxidase with cupredoxin domain